MTTKLDLATLDMFPSDPHERVKCLFLMKGNKIWVNMGFRAFDYVKHNSFLRAWINRKGKMVEFDLTIPPESAEEVLLSLGMQRGQFTEENKTTLATTVV